MIMIRSTDSSPSCDKTNYVSMSAWNWQYSHSEKENDKLIDGAKGKIL